MTPTSRPDLEELYLSKLKRAVQKRCFIVFVDYPIAEMVTSPSAPSLWMPREVSTVQRGPVHMAELCGG